MVGIHSRREIELKFIHVLFQNTEESNDLANHDANQMTVINDHKAGFTQPQQTPMGCPSTALSRNLLDRVTAEEIYRQTAFSSVQYSTVH